jgi:hypothetical protein
MSQSSGSNGRSQAVLILVGAVVLVGIWISRGTGNEPSTQSPVAASNESTQAAKGSLASANGSTHGQPSTKRKLVADSAMVPVRLLTLDEGNKPVPNARVIITKDRIFGDPSSPDGIAQLGYSTVFLDARTDERGRQEVTLVRGAKYYAFVEGPNGLPGAGAQRLTVGDADDYEFAYRIGSLLTGAVMLSDGATPLWVDWAVESQFQLPKPATDKAKAEVSRRLALDAIQVHAVIPKEAQATSTCRVAICHPKIGWFRATADLVPIGQLHKPSVVVVPTDGHDKPVLVTVRCVNPAGEEVSTGIRLMGGKWAPGSQRGFPRIGRTFTSGESQLFPPGLLEVGFLDASLVASGNRRFQVNEDTTLTVTAPFTPRPVALRLQKNGSPYRGPAAVKVRIAGAGKSFITRTRGNSEGVFRLSVAAEFTCTLDLGTEVGDGRVQAHAMDPAAIAGAPLGVIPSTEFVIELK